MAPHFPHPSSLPHPVFSICSADLILSNLSLHDRTTSYFLSKKRQERPKSGAGKSPYFVHMQERVDLFAIPPAIGVHVNGPLYSYCLCTYT